MNPEAIKLPFLHNRYFVLRHGQSEANARGLIVSDPEVGIPSYGLTQEGRRQVTANLAHLPHHFDDRLKIVSSDFLRAKQTAEIIARGLGVLEPVRYSEKLRERFFGELDGQHDSLYAQVWERDRLDAQHTESAVEAAQEVARRGAALVQELENRYRSAVLLLVAHGDVLQLLQTVFEEVDPAMHRQLPPLGVAEIRQLRPA